MISPGEISPGQWFTLRQKKADEDAAQAANWSALGIAVSTGPEHNYSSTALFCAEVVDYPLVWVRLPDGRRCLIDVTGYDLCEVKPELLQAVQVHVQSNGARSATAFDDLASNHNRLADAMGKEVADLQQKIAALTPKPRSVRRQLLEIAYWGGLAAVLVYSLLTQ